MLHPKLRSIVLLAALGVSSLAGAEEPTGPSLRPTPRATTPPLSPRLPPLTGEDTLPVGGDSDGSAQDEGEGSGEEAGAAPTPPPPPSKEADAGATGQPDRQKPPQMNGAARVTIDFVDIQLADLVKYMAEITGRNFILTEELKGQATIISHQPVSVPEAYEAFLSVLEVNGFTTVTVGGMTKVVSTANAANSPLRVYDGGNIPYTDNFVTQIIQLQNVSVTDISSVVKDLAGRGAKIIAYAPTNTLIITDAAVNIRRVYKIISELDVASPKSKLEIINLNHATAAEVEKIVEELYGSAGGSSGGSSSAPGAPGAAGGGKRRKGSAAPPPTAEASSSSVGSEGKYIEKIISDERTNSIVIMANEEAIEAVKKLIAQLDVDVDPSSRAQIHVIYLENAKAEDVAQVLSNLSNNSRNTNQTASARNRRGQAGTGPDGKGPGPQGPDGAGAEGGAVAAFDTGLRIASDENTNSLVLIATKDQFEIIKQVISNLDIRRKQVFVEAVILELTTDDAGNFGMGVHFGSKSGKRTNLYSAQLGASSIGLSQDLLTGAAIGAFGPSINVPLGGLSSGSSSSSSTGTGTASSGGAGTSLAIPAFGVVLNALQTSSSVNIVSTPSVLTLDNEEAKIVVGRNVPFPVGQSQTSFGVPIINFQREDVAITLKVTPQINESDFVTLEVFQEVQEIEGDIAAADPLSGGPTTSKRSVENVVLVKDNQTIVIGGLIGTTDNETETKIPILGDIPVLGIFFRGKSKSTRKTNLLIFLTPHIIDDPSDLEEVYRVKIAQREEFIRRFYGRSKEEQEAELMKLLSYSMNQVDQPSRFRGPSASSPHYEVIGEQAPVQDKSTGRPEETPPSSETPPSP